MQYKIKKISVFGIVEFNKADKKSRSDKFL